MRVNVYEEELTNEVVVVSVEPQPGKVFYGVRIFLESTDRLHHTTQDDDRSAVTIWLGTKEKARGFFKRIADSII